MSDISTELNESVPDGVNCMFCRYDLRMLPINGRCPECGESIVKAFELAATRRNRPPWTWHGTLLVAILMLQLLALLPTALADWASSNVRGIGSPVTYFGSILCYVFLLVRACPRQQRTAKRIASMLLLIGILSFLWFILMFPGEFDEPYLHFCRRMGWR
jgi:hypothetical protein